jgi:UDP-N-acetylglucosamine diphosphorylase / glucose-1-phosphate thymidylyltransferase / UDP-N-acetylgalactosamine diphosphorylase / glucosamine-1-phosphate N-acetyltransferase / galactosamine-1-phosphate N-acetyltransferase
MFPVILFDDRPPHSRLSPIDDLRASFEIRTGVLTTRERCELRQKIRGVVVPKGLEALTRERLTSSGGLSASAAVNEPGQWGSDPVLMVNGRSPLAIRLALTLKQGEAMLDGGGVELLAAVVEAGRVMSVLGGDRAGLTIVHTLAGDGDLSRQVMTRPWHVRSMRDACLVEDLALLGERHREAWAGAKPSTEATGAMRTMGAMRTGAHDLIVHPSVAMGLGCIFDTTGGAIFVGPEATIRHGAILIGPCAVLDHATVLDRAVIRAGTVVGPWCKVNGEIGGTIFQGYTNKAHDGYLGDSFVGEWVNLGAGTTSSNLLNTYGEVVAKASPSMPNERTGETFLGPIVGDHVKTAIGTRLMTGSVIHTGSMVATTAPASGCIPAFSWCTDEGRRTYRLDKFLEVMHAAMGRRKITPTDSLRAAIAQVHAERASARQ